MSEANEKIVNEVLMKKHNYKCPACKGPKIDIGTVEHDEESISFHCNCLNRCSVYDFTINIEEKSSRTEIPSTERASKLEFSCPNCSQKMKIFTEAWEDDYDEDREVWAVESLCDNSNCNISWVAVWILFKKKERRSSDCQN